MRGICSVYPGGFVGIRTAAQNVDPVTWAKETQALARRYAYAAPIECTNATPRDANTAYETDACNVARNQAALAAARLANLLNDVLR